MTQEAEKLHVHGPEDNDEPVHEHTHTQTKQVLKRLSYAIGHMRGICTMVEEGRDCSEVLIQLSAVDASLKKLKVLILKDHINHCVVEAVRRGDQSAVRRLSEAFDKMLDGKGSCSEHGQQRV